MLRATININSKLAGTTMGKHFLGGVVALKAGSPEDEQSILFETSRPNRLFSEPPLLQKSLTHGCTRKFTINIYIYSCSYSPHHAKLQTPFNK